MARFVSLLFFLSLSLCCCRSQGQKRKMSVRLHRGSIPLSLRANVELECVISDHSLSDSGVSWVRQYRDSAPQFILFVTSLGRVAATENGKPPERFQAKKESSNYRLTVTSFQEQDQGNYYCIVNHNQRLHFSSGIPLHLPAPATTAAPPKATTPQPSTITRSGELGGCKHSPDTEKAPKEGMDLSCNIYIWVPLASTCLLLFIALLATITVCQTTRRRRCKCKRPMPGSNGKPSLPNRYV
ncbi:T-cell surface glycoprotein CD8 alpha chain [Caretta caretta]|uniref:T-cell surface glycoprotein CD8 alpha chain n=1 Tax=Caretta caretta TaxID=8467 RepID=UPI0020949A73|nr:T-cell surface glycoprotein CD8 alpha chain [Caretta caretta]